MNEDLYSPEFERLHPTNLFLTIDAAASLCFEAMRHRGFERLLAYAGNAGSGSDWTVGL